MSTSTKAPKAKAVKVVIPANDELLNEYPTGKAFTGFPDPKSLNLMTTPAPLEANDYEGHLTGNSIVFPFEYNNEKFQSTLVEVEINGKAVFVPVSEKSLIAKFRKGVVISFTTGNPSISKKTGKTYTNVTAMEIV